MPSPPIFTISEMNAHLRANEDQTSISVFKKVHR